MPTSTTGRSNKLNRNAGFTLIELTVVLLLIGLFAGLTVPMLTGFGQRSLDSSARRLAGTVKYLYNESALSGRPYRLVFNLDEGSFAAERLETNDEWTAVGGTGRRQHLKGNVRFRDIALPGRGIFTSGEVTTEIEPVGWMRETVLHLEESGRQLTLHVKPFTGTTEVYEGYREFEVQK